MARVPDILTAASKGEFAISATQLIESLSLEPHPEGGWYRETWRGPDGVDGRAVGTAILFLLEAHQRSHWHRVDAHELWIWQAGDPLTLRLCKSESGPEERILLGPQIDQDQQFQAIVPASFWQAAEPIEQASALGYTLVTCVVTPGFEFAGFELAAPGWNPGG